MQLEELDAADTLVDDDGVAYLKGLTSISKLWLSNSKITDAGLAHLGGLRCSTVASSRVGC